MSLLFCRYPLLLSPLSFITGNVLIFVKVGDLSKKNSLSEMFQVLALGCSNFITQCFV